MWCGRTRACCPTALGARDGCDFGAWLRAEFGTLTLVSNRRMRCLVSIAHITESDTDQTTLPSCLNEGRNRSVTGEGKPPREAAVAVWAMIPRSLRPAMAGRNCWP